MSIKVHRKTQKKWIISFLSNFTFSNAKKQDISLPCPALIYINIIKGKNLYFVCNE